MSNAAIIAASGAALGKFFDWLRARNERKTQRHKERIAQLRVTLAEINEREAAAKVSAAREQI
jgi:hypothetical protein